MNLGLKRVLPAVATGALTFFLALYWREYPYNLAVLSGLGVAILTYSAVLVSERLKHLYKR